MLLRLLHVHVLILTRTNILNLLLILLNILVLNLGLILLNILVLYLGLILLNILVLNLRLRLLHIVLGALWKGKEKRAAIIRGQGNMRSVPEE